VYQLLPLPPLRTHRALVVQCSGHLFPWSRSFDRMEEPIIWVLAVWCLFVAILFDIWYIAISVLDASPLLLLMADLASLWRWFSSFKPLYILIS
jgi:hypothetical protein